MENKVKEWILFFSSLAGYGLFALSFFVKNQISIDDGVYLVVQLSFFFIGVICAGILNFGSQFGDRKERVAFRAYYKEMMKKAKANKNI